MDLLSTLSVHMANRVFAILVSPKYLKMYSNQKKMNSDAFAMKSSFKFPTSAMPNEVDSVMKDW